MQIQLTNPGEVELVPLDVGEEMAAVRNGLDAGTARLFLRALSAAWWAVHAAPTKCPFFQRSSKAGSAQPSWQQEREKTQLELL